MVLQANKIFVVLAFLDPLVANVLFIYFWNFWWKKWLLLDL